MQAEWAEHGEASFRFEVLEIVTDPDVLPEKETAHIVARRSAEPAFGFNVNPTGYSRLGRPHSQETRLRMSAAQRGRVITPEHRAKISIALTGKQSCPTTVRSSR
jgi:hypothetical protein